MNLYAIDIIIIDLMDREKEEKKSSYTHNLMKRKTKQPQKKNTRHVNYSIWSYSCEQLMKTIYQKRKEEKREEKKLLKTA